MILYLNIMNHAAYLYRIYICVVIVQFEIDIEFIGKK